VDHKEAWEKLKGKLEESRQRYDSVTQEDFFEGKYTAYCDALDFMHNIQKDLENEV
jgi:hypothetical protein